VSRQYSNVTILALAATLPLLRCTPLEDRDDRFDSPGRGGANGGSSSSGGSAVSGGANGAMPSLGGKSDLVAGTGGVAAATGGGAGGDENVSAGAAGEGCLDPTGFSGLGCSTCAPTDLISLENACTAASCVPFDNARRLLQLEGPSELPVSPLNLGGAGGAGGADGGVGGEAGAARGGSTGAGGGGSPALPACAELADEGRLLYVAGSSAAKPFLQQIAQQLVSEDVYLVYVSAGSCVGVDAILASTPITTGAAPAIAPSATYWSSAASTGSACALPRSGVAADLGVSDVFAQTCPGFEFSSLDALSVRDAHGPIQTMTFAVPATSPHESISAQAARRVFGLGQAAGVLDESAADLIWQDEAALFQRNASSGTQAMIGRAIGLLPAEFRGVQQRSSDEMAASLQGGAAEALGILAADYIDSRNLRAQIHVLAFQDGRQNCGFFPDSSATARDKRNVRDGHYPIWGPLHLLYRIDSAGNPLNTHKRELLLDVLGYLTGSRPLPNGVSLFDVYTQNGLVPECAMRVTRTEDGGNLRPYRPDSPCGCLFEARATGDTDCARCDVQSDCAAGKSCSNGYCED